ncbi:MAG: hypothetical protein ACYC2P_06430 [Paludibacteraceae bacterium]
MHTNLTLEQKYRLCFSTLPDPPYIFVNQIISKFQLNKNDFIRLLIKTDLEPYTEILWNLGLLEVYYLNYLFFNPEKSNQYNDFEMTNFTHDLNYISKYRPEFIYFDSNGMSSIDTSSRKKKVDNLELTNLLIFLLDENNNGITVNFKSNLLNKSITTRNDLLIKSIIDTLKNEYVTRKLNEVNLTYEEAEMELLAAEDRYWVRDYMNRFSNIHYINEGGCFYYEEYELYVDEENIQEYITTDMIEDYADDHFTFVEVTLDLLKEKQIELSSKLAKKVGAIPKNDNIAELAESLSYLIRLNRFFEQNTCKDITEFPLSNQDCRLIHDVLVFFGLLSNQKEKSNTTTTPENYIKALINNYRLHRKVPVKNNANHMRINSHKSRIIT